LCEKSGLDPKLSHFDLELTIDSRNQKIPESFKIKKSKGEFSRIIWESHKI